MTPISEKDTIYEQTSKATLQSALKYATEESKKTTMQSVADERKLTGTGKYAFTQQQQDYTQDDYYEEDFEDVSTHTFTQGVQYESDFEEYEEDESERTIRDQRNQVELAQVVSNYQRILESSLNSSSSYLTESFKTISSL